MNNDSETENSKTENNKIEFNDHFKIPIYYNEQKIWLRRTKGKLGRNKFL